jgi:serine/threonine protein kinase
MLAGQDPAPTDDVFALAIVAYELLTGRHPFDRLPVDEASPNPLKKLSFAGLTRSQHKALTRAFSMDRESRHASAGEFLEQFARTKVRTAIMVGIVAAAGLTVLAVAALRDGVQLEDLSAADRQQFDRSIEDGEQLLGFGNEASLNEAFQSFSQAYDILPHERAEAGLELVADRYLALLPGRGQEARQSVCQLLSVHPHVATYAPVVEVCGKSSPSNPPK